LRPPVSLSLLSSCALAVLAVLGAPAARLNAQASGVSADAQPSPVAYTFVVRFEGTTWEGSLVVFPDSAVVLPKTGSCKEMDRMRRRVSASQESWPCDGPSNVQDFQIVVDRQNHRSTSWKGTAQRPFEKTTSVCAMTRTDANGKEVCVQYEKLVEYKATPVGGRIDLIARSPARPRGPAEAEPSRG
jgi:hypothetical protein